MRSLGLVRDLGALHPRRRGRGALQVRDRHRAGRPHVEDGSVRVPDRSPAEQRVHRPRAELRVPGRRVDGEAREVPIPQTAADVDLRGPPRLVAADARRRAPRLPGPRPPTRRLLPRDGLHARRVPAGRRAPVRRFVGLPGQQLLRSDRTLRDARRLPVLRRHAPPSRHRRDRRLGSGPLPARTNGPWPASTAPLCTSTSTRGRASTPIGARSSSTTAATRSATS